MSRSVDEDSKDWFHHQKTTPEQDQLILYGRVLDYAFRIADVLVPRPECRESIMCLCATVRSRLYKKMYITKPEDPDSCILVHGDLLVTIFRDAPGSRKMRVHLARLVYYLKQGDLVMNTSSMNTVCKTRNCVNPQHLEPPSSRFDRVSHTLPGGSTMTHFVIEQHERSKPITRLKIADQKSKMSAITMLGKIQRGGPPKRTGNISKTNMLDDLLYNYLTGSVTGVDISDIIRPPPKTDLTKVSDADLTALITRAHAHYSHTPPEIAQLRALTAELQSRFIL